MLRAYPGSTFVVANNLAKWKKIWSQMQLTLAKVLARKYYQEVVLYLTLCHLLIFNLLSSADILCKQFGSRSGPTKCRA